jgi:hypothetical protein
MNSAIRYAAECLSLRAASSFVLPTAASFMAFSNWRLRSGFTAMMQSLLSATPQNDIWRVQLGLPIWPNHGVTYSCPCFVIFYQNVSYISAKGTLVLVLQEAHPPSEKVIHFQKKKKIWNTVKPS